MGCLLGGYHAVIIRNDGACRYGLLLHVYSVAFYACYGLVYRFMHICVLMVSLYSLAVYWVAVFSERSGRRPSAAFLAAPLQSQQFIPGCVVAVGEHVGRDQRLTIWVGRPHRTGIACAVGAAVGADATRAHAVGDFANDTNSASCRLSVRSTDS